MAGSGVIAAGDDAGIDFPWMLYQFATTGASVTIAHPYQPGVRSRWWLGDLDHSAAAMVESDSELALPPGSPSRWTTLWNFLHVLDRNTRSEVFRLSDPKPGVHELEDYSRSLIQAIGGALTKRLYDLYRGLIRTL